MPEPHRDQQAPANPMRSPASIPMRVTDVVAHVAVWLFPLAALLFHERTGGTDSDDVRSRCSLACAGLMASLALMVWTRYRGAAAIALVLYASLLLSYGMSPAIAWFLESLMPPM